MIRISNVIQHYGIRPVLRNVSLEIERGELVAVMGPNGMGKTTLLRVIAGILSPQKGFVEIDGHRRRRTADEENAVRRMVFYMPDDPWLPMLRTGREYLLAIGQLYGVDSERLLSHIEQLLELFILADKGDAIIQSYSTGQRKKLAICGALISEAPVMILDEPFSGGLDPSGLLSLRRIFERLAHERDRTIVMATPVPELVEGLAHRLVILAHGEVLAFDTPDGLRKQAGCEGTLQEVLETLMNPESKKRIDTYFEGMKS